MSQEQMLSEIESQAEEVGQISGLIPQDKIVDVTLSDFYAFRGDEIFFSDESKTRIIKCIPENAYYKKQGEHWLRLKVIMPPQLQATPPQSQEITHEERLMEVELRLSIIEKRLEGLDRVFREGLQEIKRYVNLKTAKEDS